MTLIISSSDIVGDTRHKAQEAYSFQTGSYKFA